MSASSDKPIIVGLFGLPGSGKTTLRKQLEQEKLCQSHFMLFEGSEVLASRVPGGIDVFKTFDELEKSVCREDAIQHISEQCMENNMIGIVTGHYMFWNEGESEPKSVLTPKDWKAFTHVLYLDLPVNRIQQQIQSDTHRQDRAQVSIEHMFAWQRTERNGLQSGCLANNVVFKSTNAKPELILDQTLEYLNTICVEKQLDSIIINAPNPCKFRTLVLLDGDKTLIPEDTSDIFWRCYDQSNPLKEIFEQGYSYTTFRAATTLYRAADEDTFVKASDEVARRVSIYPEFGNLLDQVEKSGHVHAIVISCGLKRVWENVLKVAGVSDNIKVIASEPTGIIMTPDLKGAVVDRMHSVHKKFVWAFGDSPVDLQMLQKADEAVIVVGEKGNRSRSMEAKLDNAVREGLDACQILMQVNQDAPLLDIDRLPVYQLRDDDLIQSILQIPNQLPHWDATKKTSAKLLMSATRNADCKGPALVEAHRVMGRYLATEYLGEAVGLETYSMKHVQGGEIEGHRLDSEPNTVIVPLMRGGEPMARGVWEVFPSAMYVHAKKPTDLHKDDHIIGRSTIVLVDGVINTGKSVVDFVKHIRKVDQEVKIVVIAGVVQKEAVDADGVLSRLHNRYCRLSLISLRTSANKYTGKGTTDTGHRLFNTTHMD